MSGQPGSGKSTLARKLSDSLRLISIERDIVLERYWQQSKGDPNYTKAKDGIPRYFELIRHLLDDGIDIIIDGTLYKGISEEDMASLCTGHQCVNVHTSCAQATERYIERESARNMGVVPEWVTAHIPHLEKIADDVVDSLDMGMPTIEVQTDDGYEPAYEELVKSISDYLGLENLVTNKP